MKSAATASFFFLAVSATWGVPPIPSVQNHWVANTGGNQFTRIQNFIEDMVVQPDGRCFTWSFYDEGQRNNSVYKNGAYYDINADTATHPSRRATYRGVTWEIRNFYGMGFMGIVKPPPHGDSAPVIVSSRNDTIRSVIDPTALAFDSSGRLLVGDNGPDQNVKIFQVPNLISPSTPVREVASFGEKGGVFAGPIPGRLGNRRFWGIRGLGVDSSGHVYVGCTGMPMQVGGGTHIRSFSGFDDSDSLLWEVISVAFVNTVDFDPEYNGNSVYKNATRFQMDYNKPPGKSWNFTAVTLDPFRYPDDPRVNHSMEVVWFRRVRGVPLLYLSDMYANFIAVIRFDPDSGKSEIGIPLAFIPLGGGWADSTATFAGKSPNWPANNGNKRWFWMDDNEDGQVQQREFHTYDLSTNGSGIPWPYTSNMDVDDSGSIWWGGKPYITEIRPILSGFRKLPSFSEESIHIWPIPFTDSLYNEFNGYVHTPRYLPSKDIMLVNAGTREQLFTTVLRYDHWKDSAKRSLKWRLDVPKKYPDDWWLAMNGFSSDTLLYSRSMSADTDYVYVAYIDKGPDGWRNGEISVYDMDRANRIGWIAPGPETNYMSGWFDLPHVINPFTTKEGVKLLSAEEDYGGKVNIYRWCPSGSCPEARPPDACKDSSTANVRLVGRTLSVQAAPDLYWKLDAYTIRGEKIDFPSGLWRQGNWAIESPVHNQPLYARISWECKGAKRRTKSLALLAF